MNKPVCLGLIGCGAIVRKAHGPGYLANKDVVRVVAIADPVEDNRFWGGDTCHERAIGYERVSSLEALFSQSNAVTLHCPLTSETRAMIDRKLIAAMPVGAILINTARGALIESLDMVEEALRSGQLAAAGFDCLPQEPPGTHPLIEAWRRREAWLEGRLVITPHNGFFSDRGWWDVRFQAAQTARQFLEHQVLRNGITASQIESQPGPGVPHRDR